MSNEVQAAEVEQQEPVTSNDVMHAMYQAFGTGRIFTAKCRLKADGKLVDVAATTVIEGGRACFLPLAILILPTETGEVPVDLPREEDNQRPEPKPDAASRPRLLDASGMLIAQKAG